VSNVNDKIVNIFACVLQHGNSDADMVFQFISMEAEKLFEGKWLIMHRIISEYFKLTGAMINRDEYEEFIRDASLSQEEQDDYIKLFDALIQRPINGEAFNFYVELFKEKFLHERSYVMLSNAYTALSKEFQLDKRTYNGFQGMRKYLTETMYDLDRIFAEYSPEGAVADEVQMVIDEYENLKKADQSVFTGFSAVDECTGGLSPGELWLLVGYTAEGKTSMCINIGHNAAYVHGKNVLYLTSETVKSVVRRRLIARHAFHRSNSKIDLSAWKKGDLSVASFETLQKTLKVINESKDKDGIFEIVQMPGHADTNFLSTALNKYQSRFNVDLCILDAIHLLKPKHHRVSEYSELGDMITEVKKICVSHNKGKGVPLISPWHTNRTSWERAKESGHYTLSSLAKTAEAERCADVILTIIKQNTGRDELKASLIKNRDGEILDEFYLEYDFSICYVGDSQIDKVGCIDQSDILELV